MTDFKNHTKHVEEDAACEETMHLCRTMNDTCLGGLKPERQSGLFADLDLKQVRSSLQPGGRPQGVPFG